MMVSFHSHQIEVLNFDDILLAHLSLELKVSFCGCLVGLRPSSVLIFFLNSI